MSYKNQIRQNARIITHLHNRVRESFKHRDDSEQSRKLWEEACEAFHDQYSELAFPGGTYAIYERLRAGDREAISYAVDFIELRPYFFRSGFMYLGLIRVLRNCPLSEGQRKRYDRVREKYDAYRQQARSARMKKYP